MTTESAVTSVLVDRKSGRDLHRELRHVASPEAPGSSIFGFLQGTRLTRYSALVQYDPTTRRQ